MGPKDYIFSFSPETPAACTPFIPHRGLGYQRLPDLICHKGDIFSGGKSLIKGGRCSRHMVKMERRLWDAGEKCSKERTLSDKRGAGGKVAEITLVRQAHQRHRSKC